MRSASSCVRIFLQNIRGLSAPSHPRFLAISIERKEISFLHPHWPIHMVILVFVGDLHTKAQFSSLIIALSLPIFVLHRNPIFIPTNSFTCVPDKPINFHWSLTTSFFPHISSGLHNYIAHSHKQQHKNKPIFVTPNLTFPQTMFFFTCFWDHTDTYIQ